MKIGILTFHRAHNYGAVLQCYALQEILKSMGHDVWVIDYRQHHIEEVYKAFSWNILISLKGQPRAILSYLKNYFFRRKQSEINRKNFGAFREKYLNMTQPCTDSIPTDIDCYIIGSDQLWSNYCLGGKKDSIYLGEFNHSSESKIIGYAISTNLQSLKEIDEESLKRYVGNFSSLAMREQFAADYIKKKTNFNVEVCADPTLLTEAGLWKSIVNDKWHNRNFVLMHQARLPQGQPHFLRKKAKELAAKIGKDCEVIDISTMTYTIEDFVSLFKYANYVVTTSFHATVFSLIFETPFYAIKLNDGHDERYVNILRTVGAEMQCVNMGDSLEVCKMDFSIIKENLRKYRKKSLEYLKRI